MSLPAIPQKSASRLSKFCGLLGSDALGERAAAAQKATAILAEYHWTWSDLVERATQAEPHRPKPRQRAYTDAPRSWHQDIYFCMGHASHLTPWEAEFVSSIRSRASLTPKQAARLAEIVRKIREAGQ